MLRIHPFSSIAAVRAIQSSAKLPSIVAILKKHDSGEVGNAHCPHCGAEGRYTFEFLCEDGKIRGAMQGCIRLFPMAQPHAAKLVQEAFKREADAKKDKKKLASWWADMVTACDEFTSISAQGYDREQLTEFYSKIMSAESRRQEWLGRNGYKRKRFH